MWARWLRAARRPGSRIGPLAKPGWRRRDSRPFESADALTERATDAKLHTAALRSRPSVLVGLRELARIGQ
jgi:hypothetical protein